MSEIHKFFNMFFKSVKAVNKISLDVQIALAHFMTALHSNDCNYAETLLDTDSHTVTGAV